jgi:acyl dehydratase
MPPAAAKIPFASLVVGQEASIERAISQADVDAFAALTGDFNPLHVDAAFGQNSQFKSNIVHGMLAGSLFSTLVGMFLPGESCLYLGQTLRFRRPVLPGDQLHIRGTITALTEATKTVTLKTEITNGSGDLVIDGEARVQCSF